jgi:hypothetical protein
MAMIDRRGFLVGAAAIAWSAVAPGRLRWAPATAAASPAPAARRAATFRALVAALQDAPDGRFGAVPVRMIGPRFARWYAAQDAAERARADDVLDAVGRPSRIARYHALARTAASCRTRRAAGRAAALAAAVDLAAAVCEPPPAEDERPPAPALERPA